MSAYLMCGEYHYWCYLLHVQFCFHEVSTLKIIELAYSSDVSNNQVNGCTSYIALLAHCRICNEVKWEHLEAKLHTSSLKIFPF